MDNDEVDKNGYSEWFEFWQSLKEGYDFFERRKTPPNILARNGVYAFSK